jgi:hypothetical protein
MPSVILKLKHSSDELMDVHSLEVEVPFEDHEPTDGTFSFTVKDEGNDENYCFTMTDKGMQQLSQF